MVEIDLEENDGVTTLRFTYAAFWDEEGRALARGRMGKAFDNLERALA